MACTKTASHVSSPLFDGTLLSRSVRSAGYWSSLTGRCWPSPITGRPIPIQSNPMLLFPMQCNRDNRAKGATVRHNLLPTIFGNAAFMVAMDHTIHGRQAIKRICWYVLHLFFFFTQNRSCCTRRYAKFRPFAVFQKMKKIDFSTFVVVLCDFQFSAKLEIIFQNSELIRICRDISTSTSTSSTNKFIGISNSGHYCMAHTIHNHHHNNNIWIIAHLFTLQSNHH